MANPQTIRTITSLTYMQEMSPISCENSALEETKQLIDIRDGKEYWVSKLADGNCWMVQNLALDLIKDQILTPENTDVSENWVVPVPTEVNVPKEEAEPNDRARSWDYGKYVLAAPSKGDYCVGTAPVANSSTDTPYHSVRYGQTLDRCADFQNVSDPSWQPTFTARAGSWNGSNVSTVAVDTATKTYDAHYLIGNYYQWSAVVAGSTPAPGTDATSSICPKGWRLPTGSMVAAGSGSFVALFGNYGMYENISSTVNNKSYHVTTASLYFVYAGETSPRHGSLVYAGGGSMVRSSSASPTSELMAYILLFNPAQIYPYYQESNYYGYSIRCLTR